MTDFSYQLYSSRNFGPLPETLKMVGDLGYAQVEGYGGLYANLSQLDQLKADLAANNLAMATGHFGFDMVSGQADRVLEIARALDMKGVFVPAPPTPDYREGKGDWAAFAAQMAEAGKPYWDAGLEFGYHNHNWEFGGDAEDKPIDLILNAAPGIKLEFDVAWAVRAGQDPWAWIEKYSDKLYAAHLKDLAPEGECPDEDGWADVGHGTMGWQALFQALKSAGTRLFVMEHDNPSDDRRFATRSIEAARNF
ncbi:sugar phosphate isomerase/epimerase family protein [Frigidibacter sp. ROC022]|uniref:sugar phosphate isomerase/epimerase family protein n=1 Tax=Frigidibacter sp. ROC022 TaxID=2971796 RepID=UPI00215B0076|nr:sugar phosphate isomerase/epimerase [Frigidibacter sp. ROC022]MCR8726426.1 sugar phosphate isomerase/epimerase [Frigidibacter sp. ROC022]